MTARRAGLCCFGFAHFPQYLESRLSPFGEQAHLAEHFRYIRRRPIHDIE